jgi:hypothetical protein
MHSGSSDSSQSSVAAAGAVTGTVDRAGTTAADAKAPTMSTVGTVVTPSTADSSSTAASAVTTTAAAAAPAAAPTTAAKSAASNTQAATPSIPKNSKSINSWVSCSGTSDDTSGVMKAFAAAKNGAFTLIVDCPVRLHSGTAIDHSVFIDNGTTVEFTGAGKFIVDNMFHPAFVIANSSNISLINWNVEWEGHVPINPNFGGYQLNGKFVAAPGSTQPAGAFNDLVLKPWLAANRSITFNETQGWVSSIWIGGINPAAVFFTTGDTSNVVFSGLKLYVPANAGGDEFIPMAFSVSPNWKSHQTVTGKTPMTAQYAAVPHQLVFSDLDLDGTYMGWQGSVQDSTFENITSHRYADLQDANGGTVGGIGKWFPPPHLFYLNTHATDPKLFNNNVHFTNIVDEGVRVGTARDKPGDGSSGYANSLKLGCYDCSVDGYTSHRPDGFMDVLDSDGLTLSNVVATFDSVFINNMYPAGLRFPMSNYAHITFENVQMTDTAETTTHGPLGNATNAANNEIVFSNFQVSMKKWALNDLPPPTIKGSKNDIALNFSMTSQAMKVSYVQKGALTVTVKVTPTVVRAGQSSMLSWTTNEASHCSASGSWSGSLGTSGSRAVKVGSAGNYNYGLNCQNSSVSSSATVAVVSQ